MWDSTGSVGRPARGTDSTGSVGRPACGTDSAGLLGEMTTSNHKSMRHWNIFEPVMTVFNTIQHIQLTYIHAIAPGNFLSNHR